MNGIFTIKTIGIYFLLLVFSFCISVFWIQERGNIWEEWLREFYYQQVLHKSVPSTGIVLIDSNGIPFVEYTPFKNVNPGKQYLPTTVSIYAIDYYHELKRTNDAAVRQKFFNCIEWLANNLTYRDSYALYEFTWQQPFYATVGTPWYSGLSSGRAIEAFTYAYEISNSPKYIAYTKLLLLGFYQPIQRGGFTYQENNGWWYEEYADSNLHTPHVINGHIYATLGVYRLWLTTQNDSARFIYQKGIKSLRNNLPHYDAGDGWSYYDLQKKKSDKQYHKIMVDLMEQLWIITGDEIYQQYHKKWKAPLDEPYLLRIVKERNRSGIILFLLLTFAIVTLLSGTYFILRGIISKNRGLHLF
jgi:heparosan-N-sulfate-glucuronate 5-epimerase